MKGLAHTMRLPGLLCIKNYIIIHKILYYLREAINSLSIKYFMNMFLDSPMAISATQIFERHPECCNQATLQTASDGKDPFSLPGRHSTREIAESIAISQLESGAVMYTRGCVRHLLKHNLRGKKNSIVFVGFSAQGTLARRIIDGAEKVRIFNEGVFRCEQTFYHEADGIDDDPLPATKVIQLEI